MPEVNSSSVRNSSYLNSREEIAQNKTAEKQGSLENKKGGLASLKAKFANFKAMIAGGESKKTVSERLNQNTYSKPLTTDQTKAALKNIHENRINNFPKRSTSQSARNKAAFSSSPTTRPVVTNKLLIIEPPTTSNASASLTQSQLLATPKDSPPPYSLNDPLDTSKGPPSPSYIPTPPKPEQLHGAATKHTDTEPLRSAIYQGLMQALQGERGSLISKEDVQKFSDNLSISLGLQTGELSVDQFSALGAMKSELDSFLPPDVTSKFDALMLNQEIKLMNRGTT